ncbi:MAG TPA: dCTP deaminase [Rhizomicrobium sp.]|jgi:dCTP deaminase|nr:dCTP deaminase [Rhizomicrobium sp.]
MILTDREIKIAIHRGLIRIEPPPDESEENSAYSATAVDLTLDPSIAIYDPQLPGLDSKIDPSSPGFNVERIADSLTRKHKLSSAGYPLPHGEFILAWTAEYIDLITEARLAARVEGKSSLARCGLAIHMTAPTIHCGFQGRVRLEIFNHSPIPIVLKPGMKICQLILEVTLGTPEKGYRGQFWGQTSTRKKKAKAA